MSFLLPPSYNSRNSSCAHSHSQAESRYKSSLKNLKSLYARHCATCLNSTIHHRMWNRQENITLVSENHNPKPFAIGIQKRASVFENLRLSDWSVRSSERAAFSGKLSQSSSAFHWCFRFFGCVSYLFWVWPSWISECFRALKISHSQRSV